MADSFKKTLYVYESRFMNERETTVRLKNEEEEINAVEAFFWTQEYSRFCFLGSLHLIRFKKKAG